MGGLAEADRYVIAFGDEMAEAIARDQFLRGPPDSAPGSGRQCGANMILEKKASNCRASRPRTTVERSRREREGISIRTAGRSAI